jgi:Domain of unknown function (DUF4129)
VGDGATGATRRPPSAGAPGTQRLRLILAGLLLALVIAGLRAGPALSLTRTLSGPERSRGAVIAVALEVVLAALLAALLVRRRRSPDPGEYAARLRAALIPVIIVGMIAVAVGLLTRWATDLKPPTRPGHRLGRTLPRLVPSRVTPRSSHPASLDLRILEYALIALLLASAVAAVVILLRRLSAQPPPAEFAPDEDDGKALQHAVEAGRAALGGLSDARMAIIACYLAMERSLAEAGTARADAETPDELLTRASGAGLLHGDAPARLTALFYAARFSSRPVPPQAHGEAQRALEAIAADLRAAAAARPAPAGSAAGE